MGIEDHRTNIMYKLGIDNLFDLSQTNCCGGVRMPDLDRNEKVTFSNHVLGKTACRRSVGFVCPGHILNNTPYAQNHVVSTYIWAMKRANLCKNPVFSTIDYKVKRDYFAASGHMEVGREQRKFFF